MGVIRNFIRRLRRTQPQVTEASVPEPTTEATAPVEPWRPVIGGRGELSVVEDEQGTYVRHLGEGYRE